MEGREESGLKDLLSSVSLNLVFSNFQGRNLKETRAGSRKMPPLTVCAVFCFLLDVFFFLHTLQTAET